MGFEGLSRGIKFVEIPRQNLKKFFVYDKEINELNLKNL